MNWIRIKEGDVSNKLWTRKWKRRQPTAGKVIRVVYLRLKVKCNNWQQPFLISRELPKLYSMKNTRILIHTAKMENKTTNRAKMSNKRCIKARLQYLQRGYKASEATSPVPCIASIVAVFQADLLDSLFKFFVRIIKFTFP